MTENISTLEYTSQYFIDYHKRIMFRPNMVFIRQKKMRLNFVCLQLSVKYWALDTSVWIFFYRSMCFYLASGLQVLGMHR